MAEIFSVSKQFVGMTATLINGYSSGIFHLLYRLVPSLMCKDGKSYHSPQRFDAEYGVVENTYETTKAAYNANCRASKRKTKTRQPPRSVPAGVLPVSVGVHRFPLAERYGQGPSRL